MAWSVDPPAPPGPLAVQALRVRRLRTVTRLPSPARAVALLLLLSMMAVAARAQEPEEAPSAWGPPAWTLTCGLGNAMGWVGCQGERYLKQRRLSLFVGVGSVPDDPDDENLPSGTGWAGGMRYYTGGVKHRAFLEGSISVVARSWTQNREGAIDKQLRYGPGVQLGYQRVGDSGTTFTLSTGIGIADGGHVRGLVGVGLGYSWGRRSLPTTEPEGASP